jgi:hypothetical protein
MLKKMQEKAGFISIETVIVAGLMVALGAYSIQEFFNVAQMQTDRAMNNVNRVMEVAVGQ